MSRQSDGVVGTVKKSSTSVQGVTESISLPSSSSIRQVRPRRSFFALCFEAESLLLPKK